MTSLIIRLAVANISNIEALHGSQCSLMFFGVERCNVLCSFQWGAWRVAIRRKMNQRHLRWVLRKTADLFSSNSLGHCFLYVFFGWPCNALFIKWAWVSIQDPHTLLWQFLALKYAQLSSVGICRVSEHRILEFLWISFLTQTHLSKKATGLPS
jgi:hypothetical protein